MRSEDGFDVSNDARRLVGVYVMSRMGPPSLWDDLGRVGSR